MTDGFQMKKETRPKVLFALLLSLSCLASAEPAPTPEAQQIIKQLGLREASQPISNSKGWKPERVVVIAPTFLTEVVPDFEIRLRAAAGDVELVVDSSGNYFPDAGLLAGADALIGLCRPATLDQAEPELLWLHHYFVGMERCAGLSAEQLAGRTFTNGKRLSGPTIAEHAIAMMMSLARKLPAYQRSQATNTWDRTLFDKVRFGELRGKTMLIVGLGGIGTEVAWRAHGLGMRVVATRNSSREGPEYVEYVGLSDELEKLAATADVIVNALPLTKKTSGLFDVGFFNGVKKGAIFISVGRGKSTVTEALIAALESGHLYGAGLDVTDPEPLPEDSPLWAMDNVIITPHASSAGVDSLKRGAIITVENLRRYVAGEPLLNVVNMVAGY
jgi:phosphoglycerate dehydrogenase-like enzyme